MQRLFSATRDHRIAARSSTEFIHENTQVDKIKSHIAKLQNYKVKLNEKYCTVLQIFGQQHGSQYHTWLLVKTARLRRNSGGNLLQKNSLAPLKQFTYIQRALVFV